MDVWDDLTYHPKEIFKNWVFPAYKIRRLLDRHDIVKLPGVKATEWCDVTERMYLANMELVKHFIEKEKPEKHILWYKDEHGNDVGHKYGENEKAFPVIFPEYKGRYIMDIIKEIYKWYTVDQKNLTKDFNYLLKIWSDYLFGRHIRRWLYI